MLSAPSDYFSLGFSHIHTGTTAVFHPAASYHSDDLYRQTNPHTDQRDIAI
jgi:hypothetical protein